MKIACIQLNTQNDMDANITQVIDLMLQAVQQGAALLALPENAFYMRPADSELPEVYTMQNHPGLLACQAFAAKHGVRILIGSLFIYQAGDAPDKWRNRSVFVDKDGSAVAFYDKIHLFNACFSHGESYRESDRFAAGLDAVMVSVDGLICGLSICYDMRFPRLYRDMAQAGAGAFFVPAAFTRHTGQAHWHVLLRARAIENTAYVIAPAQCGTHPGGRQTFGHSLIIDPWGQIIAEAGEESGVITAEISAAHLQAIRQQMPVLQHEQAYRLAGAAPTIK